MRPGDTEFTQSVSVSPLFEEPEDSRQVKEFMNIFTCADCRFCRGG